MLWVGALVQAIVFTITLISLGFGTWTWTDKHQAIPEFYKNLCYLVIGVVVLSWILFGWMMALA